MLLKADAYVRFYVVVGHRGMSLFEQGLDEDPDRGALACSLRAMTEAHRRFFAQVDAQAAEEGPDAASKADVRKDLTAIKAEILQGCCVLFSRIIPKSGGDPSSHPLWQLALQVRNEVHVFQRALTSLIEGGLLGGCSPATLILSWLLSWNAVRSRLCARYRCSSNPRRSCRCH